MNGSAVGKMYVYNSDGVDNDKGYKDYNFELHVSSICMPCSKYHRCKELLELNRFSVPQSLVLCLKNAFDITIRQTINPMPSQKQVL